MVNLIGKFFIFFLSLVVIKNFAPVTLNDSVQVTGYGIMLGTVTVFLTLALFLWRTKVVSIKTKLGVFFLILRILGLIGIVLFEFNVYSIQESIDEFYKHTFLFICIAVIIIL